jgi:hypothetical protein
MRQHCDAVQFGRDAAATYQVRARGFELLMAVLEFHHECGTDPTTDSCPKTGISDAGTTGSTPCLHTV